MLFTSTVGSSVLHHAGQFNHRRELTVTQPGATARAALTNEGNRATGEGRSAATLAGRLQGETLHVEAGAEAGVKQGHGASQTYGAEVSAELDPLTRVHARGERTQPQHGRPERPCRSHTTFAGLVGINWQPTCASSSPDRGFVREE